MAKIKQDAEYQQYLKNYAALLVKVNPKGSDKEIEELKKRIEARKYIPVFKEPNFPF